MRVYDYADIKHDCNLKEFDKIGAQSIVEYPAVARIAPCGCSVIYVETGFGQVDSARCTCSKHLKPTE